MIPFKKHIIVFFSISLLMLTMLSCAGAPTLNINYRVPDRTNPLEGKRIFLEVRDSRADKDLLGEGAKDDFKNASESLSLFVAEGEEKAFKIGVFPVKDLVQKIFEERLQNLGLEVESNKNNMGDEPKILVDLQSFKLDLTKSSLKKTWTARMGYNVELSEDGKVLAANKISGESEKLKIIRRKEADALMSDLVTDLVNRLNVEALFRQAGLI